MDTPKIQATVQGILTATIHAKKFGTLLDIIKVRLLALCDLSLCFFKAYCMAVLPDLHPLLNVWFCALNQDRVKLQYLKEAVRLMLTVRVTENIREDIRSARKTASRLMKRIDLLKRDIGIFNTVISARVKRNDSICLSYYERLLYKKLKRRYSGVRKLVLIAELRLAEVG